MRGEETRGRYREGGEKSVGAFSEADADGKRGYSTVQRQRVKVNRARDGGGGGGRTGGARKGRRKGRLRDRPSPERDVTEADRKKRGVCSFVTLSLTLMRKT